MRGWQAKKRRTCALPVDKGYARKCKTTRSAGGYLLSVKLHFKCMNIKGESICISKLKIRYYLDDMTSTDI